MTQTNTSEWEKDLYQLIKEYGTAKYLVSEENHDKAEEVACMSMCISFVREQIAAAEERGYKKGLTFEMQAHAEEMSVMREDARAEGAKAVINDIPDDFDGEYYLPELKRDLTKKHLPSDSKENI